MMVLKIIDRLTTHGRLTISLADRPEMGMSDKFVVRLDGQPLRRSSIAGIVPATADAVARGYTHTIRSVVGLLPGEAERLLAAKAEADAAHAVSPQGLMEQRAALVERLSDWRSHDASAEATYTPFDAQERYVPPPVPHTAEINALQQDIAAWDTAHPELVVRARAYQRAQVAAEKSPASKSGFASVQAGRRAMSRLVAGDDAAAVLGDMTAEIDAGVQSAMFD